MRFLLDSHAFLWWLDGSANISEAARSVLRVRKNEIFVSLACVWEMAVKTSLGKLRLALPFERFMTENLGRNTFTLFPVEFRHVLGVASLPFHHRDPFDRLLVAQSIEDEIPVISADTIFDRYGAQRIW